MMGSVPSSALFNGPQCRGSFSRAEVRPPDFSIACGQRPPWSATPAMATHTAHDTWRFSGKCSFKGAVSALVPSERVGLLDAWGSHLDGGPVPGGLLSLLFRRQHLLSLLVLGLSAATPLGGPGRALSAPWGLPAPILPIGERPLRAWRLSF